MSAGKANGHRPGRLMQRFHPTLISAPRPDPARCGFDLDATLAGIVALHAEIPEDAFTAPILGTEREGNGVLIDDRGLVLTIGYLIAEASRVEITVAGADAMLATVVAYDHESGFGLVRAVRPVAAAPLALGSGAQLAPRTPVIVASYGGVPSAIDGRLVSKREFAGSWEYLLREALFTAPLHPYWSGAALLDEAGRLVGIGSLYVQDALGDAQTVPGNMFVPIDLLAPIRDDLIAHGRVQRSPRPWLGVYVAETDGHLLVTGIAPAGPAARHGIRPGDLVMAVDDQRVAGLAAFYRRVWELGRAGVEIAITLEREGRTIEIPVRTIDREALMHPPPRR